MRKRVAQDILSYIESLVNCYLMNLFAISAFPQGMQLVRFVELPRGVEGFRHELNDPGSESWAFVYLDVLWSAELRNNVQGISGLQHLLFPWRWRTPLSI